MTIEQSAREERQVRVSKVGDRVFLGLSRGAGVFILVTLAGVALFLFREALPALQADATEFRDSDTFLQYVGPLVFGTVLASVLAVVLAAPLAVAVALYLTHYAPKRLARTFGLFVDLLAAIPSVVFGLWGIAFLAPLLARHVYPVLHENFGWIPLFAGPVVPSGRSMLTAGIVLAVMILPLMTAISREAFSRTPRLHEEASLALGATRWEMIRQAVLPFGRSAVVSGTMLGLGRALGETMAVAMILSPADLFSVNLIGPENPNTIAANIALRFPEAQGLDVNRLLATGLVLFAVTLVVNLVARRIASGGAA
ncbi:MAG TPA: phosphate ABC transporter permease subunit PstC [Acidimicrobiia bacterium]